MMKLQVGSGGGSLVHRADDVRAAGNTMREAELGVSWRAGAYRPEDSWLPPLLWLCVYHFTVMLTWLTCMSPPLPLRSSPSLPFMVFAVKQSVEDLSQRAHVVQVVQDDDQWHLHGIVLAVTLVS